MNIHVGFTRGSQGLFHHQLHEFSALLWRTPPLQRASANGASNNGIAYRNYRCNWVRSSSAETQVDLNPRIAPPKTIKRKVAMWIGYVGTDYKGLQIQRSTAHGQTIEEELEAAIFRAGGMLESNFGNLDKIQWMRSSRTDKGVHSLSTVISLKLEVDEVLCGADEGGINIADRINQYLPNTIRVFGISRVNKSFDPRRDCAIRVYYYLLPAESIGIMQHSDTEEVKQKIAAFNNILSSFQGRFPYHNYTVRSQYRKKENNQQNAKSDEGANAGKENILSPSDLDSDSCDEDLDLQSVKGNPDAETVKKPPKIRWLHSVDVNDKIYTAHFRNIFSFTCSEENCKDMRLLKLVVHGESFMLHQIRKMVGTAVAVIRGVFPSDIVPMSLSRPCRAVLPLAPSDGLFLAGNEFYPFRGHSPLPKGTKNFDHLPRLKMSSRVLERKNQFWKDVLFPHMVTLFEENHTVWSNWLELLEMARIPEEEMEPVRVAWHEWCLYKAQRNHDMNQQSI